MLTSRIVRPQASWLPSRASYRAVARQFTPDAQGESAFANEEMGRGIWVRPGYVLLVNKLG